MSLIQCVSSHAENKDYSEFTETKKNMWILENVSLDAKMCMVLETQSYTYPLRPIQTNHSPQILRKFGQ